jgi:hypothetical protein
MLFTRAIQPQAVVAGLVLHRAGGEIENVYSGDLDDEGFARLATYLAQMSKAKLEFVESVVRQVGRWQIRFRLLTGQFSSVVSAH